jgi:hypothetical protein
MKLEKGKEKSAKIINALLFLTDLPHTRRDSIPFAQSSHRHLGAVPVLVSR